MYNPLKKRKYRRRMIKSIVCTLEQIMALERNYYLSLPDSPANVARQEESEYAVDSLDEIIESLRILF